MAVPFYNEPLDRTPPAPVETSPTTVYFRLNAECTAPEGAEAVPDRPGAYQMTFTDATQIVPQLMPVASTIQYKLRHI